MTKELEMNSFGKLTTVVTLCIAMAFAFSNALADKEKDTEERAEIDAMADETMKELFEASPDAKALHDKSVGYAVFSNLKFQLGISGGGGKGVAVAKTGTRTYMKMGTAGIGLGIGGQKYHVVFLFETEEALESFVEKGWQADTSAQAAAGDAAAGAAASFKGGIAYFQITDKGLIASADITGTKYWKNDDLNKKETEEKKEPKEEADKEE
jgi:lipid-binding SYLF domain-containing protein